MIINIDVKRRFELKFNKTKEDDCWLWTAGKRGNNSYGGFRINSKTNPILAHRYSYLLYKGTIHLLYKGTIPKNTKVLHIKVYHIYATLLYFLEYFLYIKDKSIYELR